MLKRISLTAILILLISIEITAYKVPGFNISPYYNEQVITFNYSPDIRIHINAPSISSFNENKPVGIALFGLPNGNTIEQTVGKVMMPGDDWHYDIQHIGAQTRFSRQNISDYNLVTVYLENTQKSWPSWKTKYPNFASILPNLIDYIRNMFKPLNSFIVLTGHSGGGRFDFCVIDSYSSIPSFIKRIAFLDSNYGYDDTYGLKIKNWLLASDENVLSVLAYNDSIALYNGQPIVSATGGTWYRSKMMKKYLENFFQFTEVEDSLFIKYTALNGRVKIILKKNPTRIILHTVQVEKNGFIQSLLSGTQQEGLNYVYYGDRVYNNLVQSNISAVQMLTIPPRNINAKTGSQFMQYVMNMSFTARENAILTELTTGNIPDFLRTLKEITSTFQDANGNSHQIKYQIMPDYLAIGHDTDFCRIPMGPITAQKFADLIGATMPTRKIVDNIYQNAQIKLSPVAYTPVGNQNELVPKFIEHNSAIEQQRINGGGILGQIIGGIKKDVVISNKITDPARPNHVVIYGWHYLNGTPIQPLTNIHINSYVDYSHGIRIINSEFLLDNSVKKIQNILKDPVLYKILSDETGAMSQPSYLQTTTSISDHKNILSPTGFQLYDNYPNPFNNSTIIRYSIPETSFVQLKIYDVRGSEITELVNETKNPGEYEVSFNSGNLSSGVYFYRLISEKTNIMKKMIILK